MPYCKKDYGPLCPKCPGCTQSVFPKEVFSAFGKAYHKRCFKCQVGLLTSPLGPEQALNFSFFFSFLLLFFLCQFQTCTAPIDGQAFEVNGRPECEMCFHQSQGSVCSYCLKPIYGNSLTVLGKKRHPECFICAYCKKNLTKETAKAKGDKLYCPTCNIQING